MKDVSGADDEHWCPVQLQIPQCSGEDGEIRDIHWQA